MKLKCPVCNTEILPKFIYAPGDIATCHECKETFNISELAANQDALLEGFDVYSPPSGVSVRIDGHDFVLESTTRSCAFFFLFPFMCVWSGGSLGGIYGSQIANGKFDLFMSLFGIPFVIGSVIFWALTLMTICGKVRITIDFNGNGKIFTGALGMGYTKTFDWNKVNSIAQQSSRNNSKDIILRGENIQFGSMISENRQNFVVQALRSLKAGKI